MDISNVLLLCVLIASLYVCVDGYDCLDGWVEYDGSCYLFVNNNTMTIYKSQHYCDLLGAHLVQAETSTENDFLKVYLKQWRADRHWLGLTDEEVEGSWKWYNDGETPEYTDWAPTEPDSRGDEDCVFYVSAHGYQWGDISCNGKNNPICEKSVAENPDIIG